MSLPAQMGLNEFKNHLEDALNKEVKDGQENPPFEVYDKFSGDQLFIEGFYYEDGIFCMDVHRVSKQ